MPNRILRESILDSGPVDRLSVPAEVFYRRLMNVVDDFGRFDARPSLLRSRCYPLRVSTVREADISRWLAECETAGLIVLYSVDARQYLLFRKLGKPRADSSKYPAPPAEYPDAPRTRSEKLALARTCAHVRPYSDSSTSAGASARPDDEEENLKRAVDEFERRKLGLKPDDGETADAIRWARAGKVPWVAIFEEIRVDREDLGEFPRSMAKRLRDQNKVRRGNSVEEIEAEMKGRRESRA